MSRFQIRIVSFFFALFAMQCIYAGVSKQSIDLRESILQFKLCRNKALLKIGSREWPRLISIDLKTFSKSNLANLNPVGWFDCDESTGNYYLVNMTQNAQIKLWAYKSVGDKIPYWEKLIAEDTGSMYDAEFRQAIITDKSIVVLKLYPASKGTIIYKIKAYDKTNGASPWEFTVPNYMYSDGECRIRMKAINNVLFLTSPNGYIQAYNLASGRLMWEYRGNVNVEYFSLLLESNSHTLISATKGGSSYAEIIGLDSDTGKLKWEMDDYAPIIDHLQIDSTTSKLIYLQGASPLYKLNGYQLDVKESNNEPSLIYQWKYKNDSHHPTGLIKAQNNLYVAMYSYNDPSIFIFDKRGNKIDEIQPNKKSEIKLNYSDFSKILVYSTFDGEFGTLNMNPAN